MRKEELLFPSEPPRIKYSRIQCHNLIFEKYDAEKFFLRGAF